MGALWGLGGSSALLPHWRHGGAACSRWDPRILTPEGLQPLHSERKAVSAWGSRGAGLAQSPAGEGAQLLAGGRVFFSGSYAEGWRLGQKPPAFPTGARPPGEAQPPQWPSASPTVQVGLCAAVDLHPLKSAPLSLEDKSLLT